MRSPVSSSCEWTPPVPCSARCAEDSLTRRRWAFRNNLRNAYTVPTAKERRFLVRAPRLRPTWKIREPGLIALSAGMNILTAKCFCGTRFTIRMATTMVVRPDGSPFPTRMQWRSRAPVPPSATSHIHRNRLQTFHPARSSSSRRRSGVPWPAPGDFDVRTMPQTISASDGEGISSRCPGGFHVIFGDRQVWFLSNEIPFAVLKEFFTTDGAEKHDRETVLGPYALQR